MAARPVTWGFRDVFTGVVVAALSVIGVWFFFSIARGLPGARRLDDRDAILIGAILELLLVAVAFWFAIVRRRGSLASLGFTVPRNRNAVVLAVVTWLIGLGLMAAWGYLVDRMGWEGLKPTRDARDVIGAARDFWLVFVVVAVVAPFSEEVFFRGFAFSGLSRSLGVIVGAVGSALLFGAFHADPAVFVPVSLFGIVLAWAYTQAGSIWPPMLAHSLHNAVVLALAVRAGS